MNTGMIFMSMRRFRVQDIGVIDRMRSHYTRGRVFIEVPPATPPPPPRPPPLSLIAYCSCIIHISFYLSPSLSLPSPFITFPSSSLYHPPSQNSQYPFPSSIFPLLLSDLPGGIELGTAFLLGGVKLWTPLLLRA